MKVVTKVSLSKTFEKQLEKIPNYLKEKISSWIFLLNTVGLREVMKSKGLHDEPLYGTRTGQRSTRLYTSYRLIYRIISNNVHIELLEVHKHDY